MSDRDDYRDREAARKRRVSERRNGRNRKLESSKNFGGKLDNGRRPR